MGLPGSGKTTLHQTTFEELTKVSEFVLTPRTLGNSGGGLSQRAQRTLNGVKVALTSKRLICLAVRHLLMSRGSKDERLFLARLFLAALTRYRYIHSHRLWDWIILLDEGIVQRAVTIFVDGQREIDLSAVDDYARMIPTPDVLVYVKTDPEVAIQRAQTRPERGLSSRFQNLNPEHLYKVMTDAEFMLNNLVESIQRINATTVRVVTVDSNDISTSQNKIQSCIVQLLSGRPKGVS